MNTLWLVLTTLILPGLCRVGAIPASRQRQARGVRSPLPDADGSRGGRVAGAILSSRACIEESFNRQSKAQRTCIQSATNLQRKRIQLR